MSSFKVIVVIVVISNVLATALVSALLQYRFPALTARSLNWVLVYYYIVFAIVNLLFMVFAFVIFGGGLKNKKSIALLAFPMLVTTFIYFYVFYKHSDGLAELRAQQVAGEESRKGGEADCKCDNSSDAASMASGLLSKHDIVLKTKVFIMTGIISGSLTLCFGAMVFFDLFRKINQ